MNIWGAQHVFKHSSFTFVSTSGSGFGRDDSKTLKSVMDKSGAKIEMSSSKDQTLTFLITGSETAYLKAKSELTQAFQVRLFERPLLGPTLQTALCAKPCS